MEKYCQCQFATYQDQERIRKRQQDLRAQQRDIRAGLLEIMRQKGLKNVQVEGQHGARFQVKLSRYPVPRVLTQDVLDEARIDWAAAFELAHDEQVAHIVDEIKKVARDTRPYVDVVECGKRLRDRLPLVGGGNKGGGGGGGGGGGSGGSDPFTDAVLHLAAHKDELRHETQALMELVGTKQAKLAAASVLEEMAKLDLKKQQVNLSSKDGGLHKFVVERKVEWRRPTVTVKAITAAVKAALADHASSSSSSSSSSSHNANTRNPAVVKQRILDYIAEATRPVLHETLHFRSAAKDAAAVLCGDDDE